jgi:hypothetical protein
MNKRQKLLQEILLGHNPVCFHILGQSLADEMSEVIRELARCAQHNKTPTDYGDIIAWFDEKNT